MHGDKAQIHIKRFLRDYPDGHLYVAVGYASVWGLAWLQEHTQGRWVTLIIGSTQASRFEKATDSDRRKALALLRRRDVQVLNWYRTARSAQGASMLHAKSWVVRDQKTESAAAALVGSANLTKEGLVNNWEVMAVIAENELSRVWAQLDGFLKGRSGNKQPWNAEERLVGTIETGLEARQKPKTRPASQQQPPARKKRPPAKKKGGCLALAAAISAILAAIIATALLLFL